MRWMMKRICLLLLITCMLLYGNVASASEGCTGRAGIDFSNTDWSMLKEELEERIKGFTTIHIHIVMEPVS